MLLAQEILIIYVLVILAVFCCWLIWPDLTFYEAEGLAIFISGCDTGIGHRLAIFFSDIGCEVYAGCLNAEKARTSLPTSVHIVHLDITDDESVQTAVQFVKRDLAKNNKDLWALINNAGVCVYGQFEWQTWRQCENQVQVNILGTIRMTKAFLPLLRKSKGRIITTSSVNGTVSYPGLSIYSATKFALEGLSNAIRLELNKQHGMRVITVQPGDYARLTSIMDQHRQNAEEMWNNMSPEDQTNCEDFFHKYHRQTLKKYGLTSPNSFEGSHILQDMREAVLRVDPKNKYISCPLVHKIFYRLLAISPSYLTDFVLGKIMDLLYHS